MADVDMTDAPASAPITKKKGSAVTDGDSKIEGKKRFEVKKVRNRRLILAGRYTEYA
jgi:E3 ubiquitin-protein ligase RBX1